MLDQLEFKKLLFKTAVCAMTCDGEINPREVKEIEKMQHKCSYFEGLDLSKDMNALVEEIKQKGILVMNSLLKQLKEAELNTIQELLILEIALRIIYSDTKIKETEVRFINLLRARLKVHDETIIDRFGTISFLFDPGESHNIHPPESLDFIHLPGEEALAAVSLQED